MEDEKLETDIFPHTLEKELSVGSMRIAKPKFKALLVFAKNDAQCQAWKECFDCLGFYYDVAGSEQTALDEFRKNQHHLIVIEDQHPSIDSKQLCRLFRQTYIGSFTTIIAVLSKRNDIDNSSTARSLLTAGFNQLINATSNVKEIEDILLQLEAGPLSLQLKFRSCQAVFTALERSRDLIQIADENYHIQYVNKMYEQETGFCAKEVVGQNLSLHFENEKNEEDAWQRIKEEIRMGKEWDGYLYMKQKEGEDFHAHVVVLPLTDQDGFVHQYVIVSQTWTNNMEPSTSRRKNSYELHRKQSGTPDQMHSRRHSLASTPEGDGPHNKRANSLAKIHSMAVEAPITQIIHLISVIKESSQPSVSEVLHQILDILRNSELYAPSDFPNRSRDPMLSDFVEGLVTGTGFSHRRLSGGTSDHLLGKSPPGGSIKFCADHQSPTVTAVDPIIAAYLRGSDTWNYDVLALERITIKKPLAYLGMHILNEFDACEMLCCSPTTLHSWLVTIESKYHSSNPYHNSTHAADVLHATAYFLRKQRVKAWMEPIDEVSSLLAAIVHDVDHPGRTNAFLINSNNPLALLYNDTAVLESHHAAFSFNLTVNSDSCNIFKNMAKDAFRNLRQSMIDMVLATELSKHFEHVNKFISVVTKSHNSNANEQESSVFSPSNRSSSGGINAAINHEIRALIKRIMIKVADVINPARKTSLCVEWTRRISEEYFSQTDEEKRLGLPVVMPHFDRITCSLPKSQITFVDYFLTDMCEAWHEFCGMDEVMENLNKNYNFWKALLDKGVMKLEELTDDIASELNVAIEQTVVDENLANNVELAGNRVS